VIIKGGGEVNWRPLPPLLKGRKANPTMQTIGATVEFISTPEAAALLSLTTRRVTQLCENGTFGTKIGGRWLITRNQVKSYQKKRKAPGRPPKK